MKNWLKRKFTGIIRSLIEEMEFSQLNADVDELNKTKSEFDQRLDCCDASVKGIAATLEKEKAAFNEEKTELVRKVDDCVFSAKVSTDKTNKLKSEITALRGEIAGFDERIDDYSASVDGIASALKKEKAAFEEEKSELVRKIDACVLSAKAATDKTNNLKSEITALYGEIAGFDERIDDYSASVEGIASALEKEKAAFEEEKSELVRKIDACVSSANAAIDKTDELKNEIIVLNGEIDGFDQRIDDCYISVEGITSVLAKEKAAFEEEKSELVKRLDDCSASVDGITSALEKEKAAFEGEKTELVRKVDACAVSSQAAIDKTDRLRTEITVLNDKITRFDRRLDDCAASVEGIRSVLEKEKAAFNAEKSKFVREVDDNVFFAKEASDNTDELKDKIFALHCEIIELDKKVDDYAASVNVIAERVDNFESQLSKLFKKVDDYSEKNSKLEEKVQIFAEAFEKLNGVRYSIENFKDWDGAKAGERRVLRIKGVEFAFRYCPPGNFITECPDEQGSRVVTNSEGFSYCSPGNIMIGSSDDQGLREVTISEGFWICEVPTTQAQWDVVGIKKAIKCNFKGARLPVENVTWFESDAFVKKLNELGVAPNGWLFKLPTEIQWEYACRAGTTGSTYGVPLDEAAWYSSNSGKKTHEVGTKTPNKWGIFDMLGNVWEWTSSKAINESLYVMRGGSLNSIARSCCSEGRLSNVPSVSSISLGFRCVLVRR